MLLLYIKQDKRIKINQENELFGIDKLNIKDQLFQQ